MKCNAADLTVCTQCDTGYYLTSSGTCADCSSTCTSCNSDIFCTGCQDKYFLFYDSGENTGQCIGCDSENFFCETCVNAKSECVTCISGYKI